MTVTWSSRALSDAAAIYAYIAADDPEAAARITGRLFAATETLGRFPELGRPSRSAGRRELVVGRYVIVYRLRRADIWIVAVEHGARRR